MKTLLSLFLGLSAVTNLLAFDTSQSVTATAITSVPYAITAPGNYYLPHDLVSTSPGVAITINANEVTLDLNGRSLIAEGAAESPLVGIGIAVLNHEDVIIQNGDINNFGYLGVLFDATDGRREHNQKNILRDVNFNGDLVGAEIVSGSIDLVERCDFDGGSVGIYDVATLGGDRFEYDNFENQTKSEVLALGVGIVSTPGKGTLAEFCLFADDQTAGIIDQGTPDRLRFNSFVSNGATHIGGLSLGLADN